MCSPKRAVLVRGHSARLTVPQKIVSQGGDVSEDVAALFIYLGDYPTARAVGYRFIAGFADWWPLELDHE